MEFTVSKKQSYEKDCVYTCTSNRELHNINPNTGFSADNHMGHYNVILDSSYKIRVNEPVIRNSFRQESNILFSKITNVAEFYPGTQIAYNSGTYLKPFTDLVKMRNTMNIITATLRQGVVE